MGELNIVKNQLEQLDIKAKELLGKLQVARENDVLLLVNELDKVSLRAGQLAYGENGLLGLDWLSDRLEMLIWKTDHLHEPGALDQFIDEVRSGAFEE